MDLKSERAGVLMEIGFLVVPGVGSDSLKLRQAFLQVLTLPETLVRDHLLQILVKWGFNLALQSLGAHPGPGSYRALSIHKGVGRDWNPCPQLQEPEVF